LGERGTSKQGQKKGGGKGSGERKRIARTEKHIMPVIVEEDRGCVRCPSPGGDAKSPSDKKNDITRVGVGDQKERNASINNSSSEVRKRQEATQYAMIIVSVGRGKERESGRKKIQCKNKRQHLEKKPSNLMKEKETGAREKNE